MGACFSNDNRDQQRSPEGQLPLPPASERYKPGKRASRPASPAPVTKREDGLVAEQVALRARIGSDGVPRDRVCAAARALRGGRIRAVPLADSEDLDTAEPLLPPDPPYAPRGYIISMILDWVFPAAPTQSWENCTMRKVKTVKRPGKGMLRGAHDGGVNDCVALNSRQIASCGWDGNLRVWRIRDGSEELKVDLGRPIHCLAAAPDGVHLAAGAEQGLCWVLHGKTGRCAAQLAGTGTGALQAVAWSLDGAHIAAAALHRPVQLWAVAAAARPGTVGAAELPGSAGNQEAPAPELAPSRTLRVHSPCTALCFFEPHRLALGCVDGTVAVWAWRTGTQLWKSELHSLTITAIRAQPAAGESHWRLISAARDGVVRLWHAGTGYAQQAFRGSPSHTSAACCFAGSGAHAAICNAGPRGVSVICPLDPPRPSVSHEACHEDAVRAVCAAGHRVASCSDDATIIIWSVHFDPDAAPVPAVGGSGAAGGPQGPALPANPPPVSLATHILLNRGQMQNVPTRAGRKI